MTAGASPEGITVGPDGALWFIERQGNRIGRITTAGFITEYSTGLTPGSQPQEITAGPDGALWFTEVFGNRIGRITTAGVITEYSAGLTPASTPYGIAVGPDSALWFTEFNGNRIGRITHCRRVHRIFRRAVDVDFGDKRAEWDRGGAGRRHVVR